MQNGQFGATNFRRDVWKQTFQITFMNVIGFAYEFTHYSTVDIDIGICLI